MKKKLTKKEECQHFLHNNPKFICPSCEHNCSGAFVKEIGEEKWCARCDMNLSKKEVNCSTIHPASSFSSSCINCKKSLKEHSKRFKEVKEGKRLVVGEIKQCKK